MFIEQLSEKEISLINYFRETGANYDQIGDYTVNSFSSYDYFLRFWEQAKQKRFSKIFKDSLILKKEIEIVVEDERLHNRTYSLTRSPEFGRMKDTIYDFLEQYQRIYEDFETDFHGEDYTFTNIHYELDCQFFDVDALIANRYDGLTLELKIGENKIFKLVHGCKVMKAMGRLAHLAGVEDLFEQVRIQQSQITNEAYIKANLCLSIHPLDYFTASYNDCGWQSCMHWEDGEYRRGVVEMMNSPYVVVAYIESNSRKMEFWNCGVCSFWNSKRWREFFICCDEGIFGIKGYPFWNRQLEDTTLQWLRDLFIETENGSVYSNKISVWRVDERIEDNSVHSAITPCFSCGPAMYNDFYRGNDYHTILKANQVNDNLILKYSGISECIACGDEVIFDDPNALACEDCFERHYCFSCGENFRYQEDIIEFNGEEYCQFCYDNLPRCDCCQDPFDYTRDSSQGIKFMICGKDANDLLIDPEDDIITKSVCAKCAPQIFTRGSKEIISEHEHYPSWWRPLPIIPLARIKDIQKLNIGQRIIEKFMLNKKSFIDFL